MTNRDELCRLARELAEAILVEAADPDNPGHPYAHEARRLIALLDAEDEAPGTATWTDVLEYARAASEEAWVNPASEVQRWSDWEPESHVLANIRRRAAAASSHRSAEWWSRQRGGCDPDEGAALSAPHSGKR